MFSGYIFYCRGLLCLTSMLSCEILQTHVPVAQVRNPGPEFCLINSVEYHPQESVFCVTYTQNNTLVLYQMDEDGIPKMIQTMSNPTALLSEPQHAAFSPDGENLVVANWNNQTLTVYPRVNHGHFQEEPTLVIHPPDLLRDHKPHGIAFSPSGDYFAIAYGAAPYNAKAIALFDAHFQLIHFLEGPQQIPGIPKGITFSPDSTCLLVTFSDVNALVIYDLDDHKIVETPKQVIQGDDTGIYRPEDIKISADKTVCAVSNSEQNTVTFYPFDPTINKITKHSPSHQFKNPEACLHFPHGITFSPDGSFMIITQFGPIEITERGDIGWDSSLKKEDSGFNIYDLRGKENDAVERP